ncbi:uncharacterized protein KGF55_000306 [Candida pseudojiufengensis]|uniref:uncharacterized protein n=1 Tax=Candida pseudojiufengensis TaxID=497109 RepID=UPI0022246D31|nr:uncharacterized protein KGF55_000306 [Candida pseudojiufengensis]KAI5966897.1 hypothetical protein KGF55_000306 [Candida pseudojiufengensis]
MGKATLLLTQVNEDNAITNSTSLNFQGSKILLTNQGNRITYYIFVDNKLLKKTSSQLENNILSWANFSSNSEHYLVLLDSCYNLYAMRLKSFNVLDDIDITIKKIAQFSTKNQQHAINLERPIIVSGNEYILCYFFQANAQIISTTEVVTTFENSQHSLKIHSCPIGNIDIEQIISLNNHKDKSPNPRFAILYKDISSAYSIRVNEYNARDKKIEVMRQFAIFDENPSLLFSCQQGGIFAVTSSSLFYFPSEEFKYISMSKLIKNVVISTKSKTNHVILTVNKPSRGKSVLIYKSFEHIDERRTLLVTSNGECFMLFIDIEVTSQNSMVINQINMIDLGSLTIPLAGGLHHIETNKFVQFSKLSKSVLFEILPNKPNINVLDYIESSPPVLDLKIGATGDEIYTCQGGWEGSELRKYGNPLCPYEVLVSFQNDVLFPLKIGKIDDKLVYVDLREKETGSKTMIIDENLKVINEENATIDDHILDMLRTKKLNLIITKEYFKMNDETILSMPIQHGKIVINQNFAIIISNNKIYLFDYLKKTTRIVEFEPEAGEIISFDAVQFENYYWVVCCFFSGQFQVRQVDEKLCESVYSSSRTEDSSSAICSCSINIDQVVDEKEITSYEIYVFLLSLNGSFLRLQLSMQNNSSKLVTQNSLKLKGNGPFSLKRRKRNMIIHNRDMIYIPKISKHTDAIGITEILKQGVFDIEFSEGKDDEVLVFYESGLIEKWRIEFGEITKVLKPQSICASTLFVKCLPIDGDDYMIAVSYDQYNPNADFSSELFLIEVKSFKVVDRFKIFDNAVILDLCELTGFASVENDSKKFVCLTSSNINQLYIFEIHDQRIKLINKEDLPGAYKNADVKFSNISQIPSREDYLDYDEGKNFLLSGAQILLIRLVLSDYKYVFNIEVKEDVFGHVPSFIVDQICVSSKNAYFVDALNGIYQDSILPESDSIDGAIANAKETDSAINQFFTSIAAPQFTNKSIGTLIAGDSLGNICLYTKPDKSSKFELYTRFNVDSEQINAIAQVAREYEFGLHYVTIGSISGGVYELFTIESEEMINVLNECENELKLYQEEKQFLNTDYKQINSKNILKLDSIKSSGVFDGRIIQSWLSSLDSDPKLSKFEVLLKNKRKLQQLIYKDR